MPNIEELWVTANIFQALKVIKVKRVGEDESGTTLEIMTIDDNFESVIISAIEKDCDTYMERNNTIFADAYVAFLKAFEERIPEKYSNLQSN